MRQLYLFLLLATFTVFLSCGGGGRPPATYLALGDSLATGVGASDPLSKGYVPLVHQRLQADQYKGRELALMNLGVPGATSSDLLEAGGQLEQALAEVQRRAGEDPVEIITVDIGGNDFLPLAREGSPCLVEPFGEACLALFTETLADYEQNLRQVLKALRAAAPEANLVVLGIYNPLVGTPLEGPADFLVLQVNGIMARVAREEEIRAHMADPSSLFRQRPASEVIAPDMIHPTDAGHALLAEAVLAALEEQEVAATDLDGEAALVPA